MKQLAIVLAAVSLFSVVANANGYNPNGDFHSDFGDAGQLLGTVVQSTADGILIDGAFKTGDTRSAVFRGMFLLMGVGKELIAETPVNVKAVPAGTYTYTTVLGAESTIRALRFSD